MNEQNPYNLQPQRPMMSPPLRRSHRQLQREAMNAIGMAKSTYPKWLSQYGVVAYIIALVVVTFMYSAYNMPWYYMLSGVVSIIVYFLYGSYLANRRLSVAHIHRPQNFEKRIFWIAFVPSVMWTFLIYFLFMQNYGDAFGFENADAFYYDELGQFVCGMLERGDYHFYDEISKWSGNKDIADMGYGIYVGIIYRLTGSSGLTTSHALMNDSIVTSPLSILTVRLLKCLWTALAVLLIYRISKRNFGEQTARVATILCALWPNFWYYCGTHLKETEMTFLAVLFVEQADQMLRSRQFTAWKVIPILLIAAAIFTFRTVLGLVALLALVFSVVMSSTRVVSWGKRIIVGLLALLFIGVTVGNRIEERARGLVESVQANQQETSMQWRSRQKNGNTFAQYAGKSVFAPLIFTIPFPSMTRPFEGQDLQQLLNGGSFAKNIVSFFTIFAMVMLLMSGKWRDHLLPLSFMLGYLVVLTVSEFAQSGRFHMPVMPFEFMFVAYGLSVAVTKPKYKRWFTYWCVLMFVACIAWNWFKMAGRGLA